MLKILFGGVVSAISLYISVLIFLSLKRTVILPFDPSFPNNESLSTRNKLKVFMYDLPSYFHFSMLDWRPRNGEKWPNPSDAPPYPGGLTMQHSIEYWLTLDILSSQSVTRVTNSSHADVIFVPFFSSLSYNFRSKIRHKQGGNRDVLLQEKLAQFLVNQEAWKRNSGRDHLLVAHHPNSMFYFRKKLSSAMFVLADFGRYPSDIANPRKDIIAPYQHLVRSIDRNESLPFNRRRILAYFQGAIYRKDGGVIRQLLYYLLRKEKGVHFKFGSMKKHGMKRVGQGMELSKFCLSIAGDTPSSSRLFDAIVSHCVPVIISDEIVLPFEEVVDYSEFCIFVNAGDAVKPRFLVDLLRSIGEVEWTKKWEKLKKVSHHFEFEYPSQYGDAVDMIWRNVARKLSNFSR